MLEHGGVIVDHLVRSEQERRYVSALIVALMYLVNHLEQVDLEPTLYL